MLKKIAILFFIFIILLTGCAKRKKLSHDILEKQQSMIQTIEELKEDKIIIKYKNDLQETCYYIYVIQGSSFIQYLYTIHNDEDTYQQFIKDHEENTYYSLKNYEESYITRVTLQKGSDKDVKNTIISKYEQDKKYQIIQ